MPLSSGSGLSPSSTPRVADPDALHADIGAPDRGPQLLADLIEGRIIPQLLTVHSSGHDQVVPGFRRMTAQEVACGADAFARRVLDADAGGLMQEVSALIAQGAAVETILVELVAPAARQLGIWWEEDACDFVDVTMGLWRLQQVVHDLAAQFPGRAPDADRAPRGLFTVFPGSQHSLGIIIVEECFRRRGWQTTGLTSATEAQLLSLVGVQSFNLVTISLGRSEELDDAPALIRSIRMHSKNPSLGVMVGGSALATKPELARQIGADATASDAESAVGQAEKALALLDEQFATRC